MRVSIAWALLFALIACMVGNKWNRDVPLRMNLIEVAVAAVSTFAGDPADIREPQTDEINQARYVFEQFLAHIGGDVVFPGKIFNITAPFPPEYTVLPSDGPGLNVRVYVPPVTSPRTTPRGVVVFFHGGGWVVGSIDSHESMVRFVSLHSECVFASVEYRLAPEHKFPIPIQDSISAAKYVVDLAKNGKLVDGVKFDKFGVMGDSAGGNIASVIAQQFVVANIPLHIQVLIYPVTDYVANFPSWVENANAPILKGRNMQWYWQRYLPFPYAKHGADVFASPLKQNDMNILSKLAPAIVVTAQYDVLRDEGEAYAALMKSSGVKVKLTRVASNVHGFFSSPLTADANGVCLDVTKDIMTAFS